MRWRIAFLAIGVAARFGFQLYRALRPGSPGGKKVTEEEAVGLLLRAGFSERAARRHVRSWIPLSDGVSVDELVDFFDGYKELVMDTAYAAGELVADGATEDEVLRLVETLGFAPAGPVGKLVRQLF